MIVRKSQWGLIFGGVFLLTSCGPILSGQKRDQTNVELIQDMMRGPQIEPQEGDDELGGNGQSVRVPPQGSIPRNHYIPEDLSLGEAERLKNPIKNLSHAELTIKYENLGQEKYNINCAICHGDKGDGFGGLVEYQDKKKRSILLKNPPSLLTPTYSNYSKYSDGRMYYVITYGWGLMGSYANQIHNEKERWAVVNYVRELQKMGGATHSKKKGP